MKFVFLCDHGFGEKKENIKWLEYEVKLMFSVKATLFQINFVVKFIPRPPWIIFYGIKQYERNFNLPNRLIKRKNKRINRTWASHGQ